MKKRKAAKRNRLFQYELTTNWVFPNEMPYSVFAKNKNEARNWIKNNLRKSERIISLERSYWTRRR
jgi:hypothetical protein